MTTKKTYPKETPLESVVIDMVEKWQDTTPPGHGMFFDFEQAPELQKPVMDYLQRGFGWKLERPFFIRKPEGIS